MVLDQLYVKQQIESTEFRNLQALILMPKQSKDATKGLRVSKFCRSHWFVITTYNNYICTDHKLLNAWNVIRTQSMSDPPGLKPGRVIRVNRVTFFPGHPGLTHFIKYPGLTRIGSCTIIMASGGESCRAQSHTSKVYLYKIQILLFSDHSLGIGIYLGLMPHENAAQVVQ